MTTFIGSVPYLNGKPLTRWFHHSDEGAASNIKVRYEHPTVLAELLAAGEIDAALVSSYEYFRTPGYVVLPGVSISGQDEILSVRAFSRVPWRKTETVALDTSSLTSVALLKILLAELFDAHPAFVNCEPDFDRMLEIADAGLLIGDKGMLFDGDRLNVLDLGRAWRQLTRSPFVYAVWMGSPKVVGPELVAALNRAKEWGEEQVDIIAEEEAARLGCSADLCRRYLTEIMDYDLSENHIEALELFGRKAFENGLLAEPSEPVRLAATRSRVL